MPFDEVGTERRRASLARNAENASRSAFATQTFEVSGAGVIEFPKSAQFGLTFISRPTISVGCLIDMDELAAAYGLSQSATPPVPIVTGFVTEWDTNERDWFVGAWCAVNVYWNAGAPSDAFTFEIDFTFRGIGIKDVDPEVRT